MPDHVTKIALASPVAPLDEKGMAELLINKDLKLPPITAVNKCSGVPVRRGRPRCGVHPAYVPSRVMSAHGPLSRSVGSASENRLHTVRPVIFQVLASRTADPGGARPGEG